MPFAWDDSEDVSVWLLMKRMCSVLISLRSFVDQLAEAVATVAEQAAADEAMAAADSEQYLAANLEPRDSLASKNVNDSRKRGLEAGACCKAARDLCDAFLDVCTMAAAPGRGSLELTAVRRAVVRRRREFRGARQHDCHEFLSAVLDILSDELAPQPMPRGGVAGIAKTGVDIVGEHTGTEPSLLPGDSAKSKQSCGKGDADGCSRGGCGNFVGAHFGVAVSRTLSCLKCGGGRRRHTESLLGLSLSVPAEDPLSKSQPVENDEGESDIFLPPPPPPIPPHLTDLIRQYLGDASLDVWCPACRFSPAVSKRPFAP